MVNKEQENSQDMLPLFPIQTRVEFNAFDEKTQQGKIVNNWLVLLKQL